MLDDPGLAAARAQPRRDGRRSATRIRTAGQAASPTGHPMSPHATGEVDNGVERAYGWRASIGLCAPTPPPPPLRPPRSFRSPVTVTAACLRVRPLPLPFNSSAQRGSSLAAGCARQWGSQGMGEMSGAGRASPGGEAGPRLGGRVAPLADDHVRLQAVRGVPASVMALAPSRRVAPHSAASCVHGPSMNWDRYPGAAPSNPAWSH